MWFAELYHCIPGRNEAFALNQANWQRAQVLVLLANPSQLVRIKRQLQILVGFKKCDYVGVGRRVPLVLLMDEDDDNVQTFRRNRYKKEIHLNDELEVEYQFDDDINDDTNENHPGWSAFSANPELNTLVDTVYHCIGISATHHSNLIAEASTNKQRKLQIKHMDIPYDYCGFCLPQDSLGHEIQCMEIEDGVMTVMVEKMIEDGCKRFTDEIINSEVHQLSGPAVVQLAIPQAALVKGLEDLAEHMAGYAKTFLDLHCRNNVPIIVCTMHGKATGNVIFVYNWDPNDVKESLLEDLGDNARATVGSAKVITEGAKLNAHNIMNLFRTQLTKASNEKLPGIYCGIVAHARAGRAVTFK